VDLTVVVGTFGEESWRVLAEQRAIPSARQLGVPVIHHHADTLHDARNGALAQVRTEWVVHLDADDELEAGYLAAMARGSADVRAPAVRYVKGRRLGIARMPAVSGHAHGCVAECLAYGNWLVVGAAVRTELARAAGWRDYPWSEDWDLWARIWQAGATVEAIPEAIYRAHVRPDSRNRSTRGEDRLEAHRAIARANGLPVP
jgi:hypothetical protein